jgi:hypothetical protein
MLLPVERIVVVRAPPRFVRNAGDEEKAVTAVISDINNEDTTASKRYSYVAVILMMML